MILHQKYKLNNNVERKERISKSYKLLKIHIDFIKEQLKTKKKKKKSKDRVEHTDSNIDNMMNTNPTFGDIQNEPEPILQPSYDIPKSKTTIRRY